MTEIRRPSLPLATFLTSATGPEGFPSDTGREVVFAGRSNCGKSTAINAITQRRGLARTSKTPGRTQLINFFDLPELGRLADLPGYGYAQVPDPVKRQWADLMASYFAARRSLVGMMLVMDARRPLGPFDQQMLEFAARQQPSLHVLLSKADKLNRSESTRTLRAVREALGDRATAQLFSGLRRTGVDEARRVLLDWMGEAPAG